MNNKLIRNVGIPLIVFNVFLYVFCAFMSLDLNIANWELFSPKEDGAILRALVFFTEVGFGLFMYLINKK